MSLLSKVLLGVLLLVTCSESAPVKESLKDTLNEDEDMLVLLVPSVPIHKRSVTPEEVEYDLIAIPGEVLRQEIKKTGHSYGPFDERIRGNTQNSNSIADLSQEQIKALIKHQKLKQKHALHQQKKQLRNQQLNQQQSQSVNQYFNQLSSNNQHKRQTSAKQQSSRLTAAQIRQILLLHQRNQQLNSQTGGIMERSSQVKRSFTNLKGNGRNRNNNNNDDDDENNMYSNGNNGNNDNERSNEKGGNIHDTIRDATQVIQTVGNVVQGVGSVVNTFQSLSNLGSGGGMGAAGSGAAALGAIGGIKAKLARTFGGQNNKNMGSNGGSSMTNMATSMARSGEHSAMGGGGDSKALLRNVGGALALGGTAAAGLAALVAKLKMNQGQGNGGGNGQQDFLKNLVSSLGGNNKGGSGGSGGLGGGLDSLSGGLDVLQGLGDLKGSLGGGLGNLGGGLGNLGGLGGGLGNLGGGLGDLGGLVSGGAGGLKEAGSGIKEVFNGVKGSIATVGRLSTSILRILLQIPGIKARVLTEIADAVTPLKTTISDVISENADDMRSMMEASTEIITDGFDIVINLISDVLALKGRMIASFSANGLDSSASAFDGGLRIGGAVVQAGSEISEAVGRGVSDVVQLTSDADIPGLPDLSGIPNILTGLLGSGKSALGGLGGNSQAEENFESFEIGR